MAEQHYIHQDGRRCMRSDGQGYWRHWDHEPPEPGPRETRDYKCNRHHLKSKIMDGPLPSPDLEAGLAMAASKDRGEFGMPGLGVTAGAKAFAGEVTGYQYAQVDCPEEPLQEIVMWVFRNAVVGQAPANQRVDAVTDEARFILEEVLPHLLMKFLRKNAQYARAQTGHDLGIKGIIPDINRKAASLVTRVWDGDPTSFYGDTDDVVDIAEDLIGHLLLLLAKTREA